jgi:hypothetical protein
MSTELEYWYPSKQDPNAVLLIGEVSEIDESFDHAFGTENRTRIVVEDFSILMFMESFEYDVTRSFREVHQSTYARLREWFLQKATEDLSLETVGA